MSVGTFMVARTIWDHPEFAPSTFSEREAFLWLVSEAAWKPRRKRVGKVVVDLERGQLAHSTRFLSGAWDWSHSKVRRFLERIENRHMIERHTDTGVSVIYITNYETYQGSPQASGTAAARKAAQKRHSSGTNENKGNKGNKEDPPLSPQEGGDAVSDFEQFWEECPLQVAKGAAERAYSKALKITDAATIFAAMRAYAESRAGKDDQFTAHPSAWLKARRWEDTPKSQETHEANNEFQSAIEEIERLERERIERGRESRGGLRVVAGMDGGGAGD